MDTRGISKSPAQYKGSLGVDIRKIFEMLQLINIKPFILKYDDEDEKLYLMVYNATTRKYTKLLSVDTAGNLCVLGSITGGTV